MERQPWFCPSCQKHHAPHVDTCPGVADAIGFPYPGPGGPLPTVQPLKWEPTPDLAPKIICGGVGIPATSDPGTVVLG